MLFLVSFLIGICRSTETFSMGESYHITATNNRKDIKESSSKLNMERNETIFEYLRQKISKILERESSAEREFAEFVNTLEKMDPNTREIIRRYFKALNFILSLDLPMDKVISLIPKLCVLVGNYGLVDYSVFENELLKLVEEEIKFENTPVDSPPADVNDGELPRRSAKVEFSDWDFFDEFE